MVYVFAVVFVAQFEKQRQHGEEIGREQQVGGPMPQHVLKLHLAVPACISTGALLLHSVGVSSTGGRWFGAGC